MTEDEMAERQLKQTQGDSEGQGSLACCSSWVRKESDTTQQLNNGNSTKYLLAPGGRRKS